MSSHFFSLRRDVEGSSVFEGLALSMCLDSRALLAASFSSYCMYAWAFRRRESSMVGVPIPTALANSLQGQSSRSSRYFFILSVVGTWTTSLLKHSMYARRDSSLPCMIASSEASDLGCQREAVKCLENILPSCLHEVMDSSGKLLYHAIAPFLRVVEKSLHLMAPLTPL